MVQEQSEESNLYDFFLVSQETTQGCVLPTHFFCSFDNAQLEKKLMQ